MKALTKTALLSALGIALAGLSAYSQPGTADQSSDQQPPGPPHRRPPLGAVVAGLLDKYDVNHDGQLDQTEMAALKKDIEDGKISPPEGAPGMQGGGGRGPGPLPKEILDKYDINKDGKLDETERAALRKDIEDGKISPPEGAPGIQGGRGRGPGPLPKEILDKYDVNKDGKLDETERAALRKDIEDGKIQPPAGRGQRGAGPGMGAPPSAKEILARFDIDKDGKLDEAELTAFLQDMQQHHRGPGGPGGPGRPGGPGGPGGPPPGDDPEGGQPPQQ